MEKFPICSSDEKIAALLDNLPGGYHCCSPEEGYPFLYISDRFLDILGWTKEEIEEKFHNQFLNLLHPDDRELIVDYVEKMEASDNGRKYQDQIYRLKGREGYHWVTDTSLLLKFGEERVYQGCISDITEFIVDREKKEKEQESFRTSQMNTLTSQLDKERQYLEVLYRKYVLAYYVDLNNDKAEVLKLATHANVSKMPRMSSGVSFSYEAHVNDFAEQYVSGNKQRFREMLGRDNLFQQLKNATRFVFRFESIPNLVGNRHYEVQVVRVNPDVFDGNVIVFSEEIDDVVMAELKNQFELEERLEREKTQNEVLSALGADYHAIFRINLQNDTYTRISCREQIRYYYNDDPSAAQMLEAVCVRIVDSKHYERMRRFFDLSTLAQRLRDREFVETECITKEGTWHRVRLIVKRRDDAGCVTHVLYVTQIINDEKLYEEHLLAKAEYAELANQTKSSFISQVAHDIRTPMNSIFGFLEIAEANLGNWDKVKYSLEKIRVAGEFLKDLANDVLDLSRIEDGRVKLQPEEVNISHLLEEVTVSMQNAKFGKKQIFCSNIHDILYDWIIVDALRLKQIYTNVLSNAIKYTPDGGTIEFNVYQEEITDSREVCLVATISDTGIGMSQEFMEKMYTKFERETDTRINKVSGYGLGLSIVKELVELMNGDIDVKSKPGEGTTFCIRLTFPYIEKLGSDRYPENVDNRELCAGMHLLIAEDNSLNREVITELLGMNGITCECAEDGVDCLKRFREAEEGTYDAILMDMQMPVMNGVEATRKIRELFLPWAKTIPIIAMTANAMKDDVQKCLDAGMNRHLPKPVDIRQLMKTLVELKDC